MESGLPSRNVLAVEHYTCPRIYLTNTSGIHANELLSNLIQQYLKTLVCDRPTPIQLISKLLLLYVSRKH